MRGRTFCRKGGLLGPIGSREGMGAVASSSEVTGGSTFSVRFDAEKPGPARRCVCAVNVADTLATLGFLPNASFGIGTFVHTCDIRVESWFRFCSDCFATGSSAGGGSGVCGDGKGEGNAFRKPSRLRLPPSKIPFCDLEEVLPVLLELVRLTATLRANANDPASGSASRISCTRSTRWRSSHAWKMLLMRGVGRSSVSGLNTPLKLPSPVSKEFGESGSPSRPEATEGEGEAISMGVADVGGRSRTSTCIWMSEILGCACRSGVETGRDCCCCCSRRPRKRRRFGRVSMKRSTSTTPLSLNTAAVNTVAAKGMLSELNSSQRATDTGSIKACSWEEKMMGNLVGVIDECDPVMHQ